MYRNPTTQKLSWSWSRLITNAVPNFANSGPATDADLTPTQKDNLFRFQLTQPDPPLLNELSFYIAGVVESQSLSPPLHKKLHRVGILTRDPPYLSTALIDRNFTHKLATLSIHRQRKLVGMLFFWEEELVRWRLLDEEEAEIRLVMKAVRDAGEMEGGGEGEGEELKVALGTVLAKREMVPGMRGLEGKGGLPGYGEGGTLGIAGGK